MAENKSIGILIGTFVALLIGIIAVTIIAENTINKTALLTSTDTILVKKQVANWSAINSSENFTLTNIQATVPWGQTYSECIPATLIGKNNSGVLLVVNTDYKYDSANGKIWFLDTGSVNASYTNTTTFTYTYCGDDYVTEGWARTIFNMVPGFFALALMVGAAFIIFWILKQEGVTLDI